jgi:hypothetical protein
MITTRIVLAAALLAVGCTAAPPPAPTDVALNVL